MAALVFQGYWHATDTGSFTPAAGDCLIVAVAGSTSTTPNVSDTQSLGWTQLTTALFATSTEKLSVFASNAAAAASAMTVNTDLPAGEGYIAVWRVTGAGHFGAAIAAQIVAVANRAGSQAPNAVFSTAADAANACLSVLAVNSRTADTAGPTVGTWTRDFSDVFAGTAMNMWADHAAAGGFTGTDPTYTDHPGNGTSFAQVLLEVDLSAGATDHPLDAAPGSFAVTGTASKPVAGRAVSAAPGSYAVTGDAAALPAARVIPAAPGSFALVGDAAAVVAGRVIGAGAGSVVVTGDAADLVPPAVGFTLDAAPASFAVTGDAAGLLADRILGASPGTVALDGDAATLPADRAIGAAPGSYSVTGFGAEIGLPGAFSLDAAPGAFTLTGQAAGTLATRKLDAAPAAYALTGDAIAATLERVLLASPGSLALTGAAAILAAAIAARVGTVVQADTPTASVALAAAAPTVTLAEAAPTVTLSDRIST